MKSEERKSKSRIRVALFTGAMGIVMLSSLGIVGRHAASSKTQVWVIAAPASTEASSATAQADGDIPETRLAGHSELVLQCD